MISLYSSCVYSERSSDFCRVFCTTSKLSRPNSKSRTYYDIYKSHSLIPQFCFYRRCHIYTLGLISDTHRRPRWESDRSRQEDDYKCHHRYHHHVARICDRQLDHIGITIKFIFPIAYILCAIFLFSFSCVSHFSRYSEGNFFTYAIRSSSHRVKMATLLERVSYFQDAESIWKFSRKSSVFRFTSDSSFKKGASTEEIYPRYVSISFWWGSSCLTSERIHRDWYYRTLLSRERV